MTRIGEGSGAWKVSVRVFLRMITPQPVPGIRASLGYDPDDPCTVTLTIPFPDVPNAAAVWSFGRDLLAAGLDEPAGYGDVRIWPSNAMYSDTIALRLTSEATALFETPRGPIAQFLHDTFASVPRGTETDHMHLDRLVDQLLAES